jgi:hypothetical protein
MAGGGTTPCIINLYGSKPSALPSRKEVSVPTEFETRALAKRKILTSIGNQAPIDLPIANHYIY